MCEKRHKMINTMPNPTAKFILYMDANNINATKIMFPKIVSNKLTNKLGTANITIHKTTNNEIKPTTKFRFLRENSSLSEKPIYIINAKKVEYKALKKNILYISSI